MEDSNKGEELYPVVELCGLNRGHYEVIDFESDRFRRNEGLDLGEIIYSEDLDLLGDNINLFVKADLYDEFVDLEDRPEVAELLSKEDVYYVVLDQCSNEIEGYPEFPKSFSFDDFTFTYVEDLPTRLGELAAEGLSKYSKDEIIDGDRLISKDEMPEMCLTVIDKNRDPFQYRRETLRPGFNLLFPFSESHANRFLAGFEKTLGAKLPSRFREEMFRSLRDDISLFDEEQEVARERKESLRSGKSREPEAKTIYISQGKKKKGRMM